MIKKMLGETFSKKFPLISFLILIYWMFANP